MEPTPVIVYNVCFQSGTYDELLEHSGAFAEFLENYPSKECLQKSSGKICFSHYSVFHVLT